MCITLESDYAIRIMNFLAKKGSRVDAKTISEETQVTLRFALKILRKLVTEQLVKSYKGVKGGYELAKEPKDITLFDIIKTIEGDCYLSRCLDDNIGCPRNNAKTCKTRVVFSEVSKLVEEKLRKCNLSELI